VQIARMRPFHHRRVEMWVRYCDGIDATEAFNHCHRRVIEATFTALTYQLHVSRCNAVRRGLTAETIIGGLEDAEDYKAFEGAIIADYDAQSAVERELVLRLASLLWRLRRATTMETGLFEVQAAHLRDYRQSHPLLLGSRDVIDGVFRRPDAANRYGHDAPSIMEALPDSGTKADAPAVEFARLFLRLANLPNCALDRLGRYEATLWRQAKQILYALEVLDRFAVDGWLDLPGSGRDE
jgi:hypothetical protein